jgi:hypothetical protein
MGVRPGASTRKVPSELGRSELLHLPSSSREDTCQMRLLHEQAKIHATFDEPHLVSQAGLVPVMALAQQTSLDSLVAVQFGSAGRAG